MSEKVEPDQSPTRSEPVIDEDRGAILVPGFDAELHGLPEAWELSGGWEPTTSSGQLVRTESTWWPHRPELGEPNTFLVCVELSAGDPGCARSGSHVVKVVEGPDGLIATVSVMPRNPRVDAPLDARTWSRVSFS